MFDNPKVLISIFLKQSFTIVISFFYRFTKSLFHFTPHFLHLNNINISNLSKWFISDF
ncbi:hypothetical protein HMPREF9129_2035 [Peptoniphilus indolicus ATCC 29427]|uniref:Uncharacterized protein n=1 Tax=Peptoniphilus indolicus ATCC 29427 TaxID=997350 RepID=G4D6K5_9FIRM|nr:hypothetical protein HMPREF9129_2035 [Peptoniphilus indolicus ATCC 29427]